MKTYTINVGEDEQGQFLPLPDELLKEVGWKAGDLIEWIDNKDGTWTMKKNESETELVLVDCIQTSRMRYLVEVPKGKTEWALDTVVSNKAQEFSQLWLGETIVSHRVVDTPEAITQFDVDNDYLKYWWTTEKKLDTCVTRWEEPKDSLS